MFKSSLTSKIITVLGLLFFLIAIYAVNVRVSFISAQEQTFTLEELSQYDGQDGRRAYYAFEGVVYDVTDSPLWKLGKHFEHSAGEDLTGALEGAPHGDAIVKAFPVVGVMADGDSETAVTSDLENVEMSEVSHQEAQTTATKWYQNRIRLFGFSILGWTGIVLAVFFILTFATCFAMPWAKLPLPWKGKRLGPDPLDEAGRHLPWTAVHKYFVWVTVIFGVVHGVIGFMQMIWGMYL